jgi:hypothetical protein
MIARTPNTLVVFHHHPFELRGVDPTLPEGEYRVMTRRAVDRGIVVSGLRRVSTVIFAPGQSPHASSFELATIKARSA